MRKKTNRFSSMQYKKGGEKQEWISNKIATLLEEDPNMPQKQAISIALSMVEKQFANGGDYSFNSTPNFKPIEQPKVQGFGYDQNFQSQISPTSITAGEDFKKDNPLPQGTFEADPFGVSANKELEAPKKTTENFQPTQFFNPYADVDLAQGMNTLGQSIENGDALGIVAGGLKTLTGTARNIFGGMGQARIKNEGMKNYYDAQRDNIVGKSQQGQNGGAFPNFQDGGEKDLYGDGYENELINKYGAKQYPTDNYSQQPLPQQEVTNINQEPQVEPTTPPSFDTNSARDTWVQKTGLPWSEAKKLGYTDGSAKDNKKLLSELNDPRFKKEYLRTEPIQKVTKTEAKKIIPKAEATPQLKKEIPLKKQEQKSTNYTTQRPKVPQFVLDHKPVQKGVSKKQLTESELQRKMDSNAKNYKSDVATKKEDKDFGDYIEQGVEYAGNPGQALSHLMKYGDLPAKGFSKNGRTDGFDDILGRVNPAKWFNAGFNALDAVENEDYNRAGKEALNAAGALSKLKYVKYVPINKALPAARTSATQAIGQGAKRLYQDGGEQGNPMQMVSEALQQGATEEQIAQILLQQGYSEEEIGQIFQQLQGQQSFQDGGEQQGQAEQIYQMVAEALQSGADPQEIAQQLTQMGLSEQEVMQIIQEVMAQMQQPTEPQQTAPQMKMGGSFDQLIGKKILGYEYNKDKDTYSVRYE